MTPEQEKMLREWAEHGVQSPNNTLRHAVAALLARCEKAEAELDKLLSELDEANVRIEELEDLTEDMRCECGSESFVEDENGFAVCAKCRGISSYGHALIARLEKAEGERDAALAKLAMIAGVPRYQLDCGELLREEDGYLVRIEDISAALAAEPEIVAVVDGSIMTASGGSTHWHEFRAGVDLPHGDYRAIILRGDGE